MAREHTDSADPTTNISEKIYDVTSWEERTWLDRVATRLYGAVTNNWQQVFVVLAIPVFLSQFFLAGYIIIQPGINLLSPDLFVGLSVIPALLLALFIWQRNSVHRPPLMPLAITFLLGVLFAAFAMLLNSTLQPVFQLLPAVGMLLFFYLVVGPVEETSKWLAVRVHGYQTEYLTAAIDGAVFGAFAGLGFATIENVVYIVNALHAAGHITFQMLIQVGVSTAITRAFAGPGHVVYASLAGYYLGLAKLNPSNRGPIIVKGLLIAIVIHATYDALLTYLPLTGAVAYAFMVLYIGFFFVILYRKLSRSRAGYRKAVIRPADD